MPTKPKARGKKTAGVRDAAASYAGPGGEILLYNAPDGTVRLDVRLEQETIWLSQKQMALLFDTERSIITKHLGNIFKSGELDRDSVCANFAQPAAGGKTYQTDFFNLDATLSVGYRVNSKRGTQFRMTHLLCDRPGEEKA